MLWLFLLNSSYSFATHTSFCRTGIERQNDQVDGNNGVDDRPDERHLNRARHIRSLPAQVHEGHNGKTDG